MGRGRERELKLMERKEICLLEEWKVWLECCEKEE